MQGGDHAQGEKDAVGGEGVEGGVVDKGEGRLIVVVSDTGAGISKANQKQLFKEGMQFNPEKLQAGGGRFVMGDG